MLKCSWTIGAEQTGVFLYQIGFVFLSECPTQQVEQSRDRFCFYAQVSLNSWSSETRDVDHCTVQCTGVVSVQMPLTSWSVEPADSGVHSSVIFNRAHVPRKCHR